MMRIVVAPNSYRGSANAFEVAAAIAEGVRRVLPQTDILELPVADGGELTSEVIFHAIGGSVESVEALDPLGRPVIAKYVVVDDGHTAVVEVSAASGIKLVAKHQLDPMHATSYGTGQMIKHALNRGCRRIIIGLGGSATVDGGIGMLQAIGARILDADGADIGLGGAELLKLNYIDTGSLDPRIASTEIIGACDVDIPLFGPSGAALMFGPQKGATKRTARFLDSGLQNLAWVIATRLNCDLTSVPYAGASGGIGAALYSMLGAQLVRGIDLVLQYIGFREALEGCQLVVTGEGSLDEQTLRGKAPLGVAEAAHAVGIPVIAIVGGVRDHDSLLDLSAFDAVVPICNRPMSMNSSTRDATSLIAAAAERSVRLMAAGTLLGQHLLTPSRPVVAAHSGEASA